MNDVFWVFGYGSLMWDPGFGPVETVKARLEGYSRSFCLRSTRYRGTEEAPGLVLGLDSEPGASCAGLALRIPEDRHAETLAYLRERELDTGAYDEMVLPLTLQDGRRVQALAYVMKRDHWQYAGGLCVREQARIIAGAAGGRGPNADYLFNTARHLAEIGLADAALDQLSDDVRRLLMARRDRDAAT
ncbi:gamma-glutamylcyclotransferase [Paracoccus sp. R12_1]|jgi:glutathione-specific gamma-glutamylcyclotransferase|uniref:gamma-glutamylcyclotransferase n=1 Tax=unclassified Paracoccus (in: a-proteobacteria) TaxID=2688777 RepID=UPI001ADAA68C|nr:MULTISPECIES: gamma-glutamylcyclotransferase [unclassified Paracoccus (in: a-proteobacteria)]MBO9455495.1 gamma-glutamylcyclotransferase [Paracoccus sp. R12_2]MBO9485974.1 gamma-glutamylcyclotransferase [Paracoccus sp. R12_1]